LWVVDRIKQLGNRPAWYLGLILQPLGREGRQRHALHLEALGLPYLAGGLEHRRLTSAGHSRDDFDAAGGIRRCSTARRCSSLRCDISTWRGLRSAGNPLSRPSMTWLSIRFSSWSISGVV